MKMLKKEPANWTEDDIYQFTVRSIARVMYDAIATHEAHEQDYIAVEWLRDYADNITATFPRILKEE